MDAAGQSSAAESRTSEQDSGLESQQSEYEQRRRGIRSSDGVHANFTPPERLGIDNTNVERGIRSIPNLSQIQSRVPRPTTVASFQELVSGPRVSQGHTSIQGSSHLSVDTLQQRSSAVQRTHPWGAPSHLPSSGKRNIPVAPSQSAQPPQSSNQMTPERTRKKPWNNNEANGCNCKRLRCMQLNCKCFLVGRHCADICSCVNCLNKAQNDDTDLDLQKQAELSDPHASAPKVVKQDTGSPANVQSNLGLTIATTSSSAIPIARCNCTYCNCLNKHCGCVKANVRCSELCMCENCANPLGTRATT